MKEFMSRCIFLNETFYVIINFNPLIHKEA